MSSTFGISRLLFVEDLENRALARGTAPATPASDPLERPPHLLELGHAPLDVLELRPRQRTDVRARAVVVDAKREQILDLLEGEPRVCARRMNRTRRTARGGYCRYPDVRRGG